MGSVVEVDVDQITQTSFQWLEHCCDISDAGRSSAWLVICTPTSSSRFAMVWFMKSSIYPAYDYICHFEISKNKRIKEMEANQAKEKRISNTREEFRSAVGGGGSNARRIVAGQQRPRLTRRPFRRGAGRWRGS